MSRARDIADGKFSGAVVAASADFTGTVEAADLSDGTTTVGTEYVTNGSAKAWVNFNGTGTIATRDSLNVSSLTDNGTGDYLISYTSNMQGDDYAFSGAAADAGSVFECWFGTAYGYPTASNIGVGTGYDTPVVQDTTYVSCIVMGDLA